MENSDNNNQSRFVIAAVLSIAVLFGWTYFFAPQKPTGDANANVASNTNSAASTPPQPATTGQPQSTPEVGVTTPDTTPNRLIKIKSPLYEVTLDTKGAVATSWVIVRNNSPKSTFPLYADGSNDDNRKPLELIGEEALSRSPREVPFRLATDDQALNTVLNERNYQSSLEGDAVSLSAGEEKQIEFTLTDANGVEVKKTFLFRADSYIADVTVNLGRGGQPVPNTRLLIGASIGDHAINNHNFYHIEPEAVSGINDDIKRHPSASAFTFDSENNGSLVDTGKVDWAAVGDAYFAMAAIPSKPADSVEYKAFKYEVQTKPFFESIFQWVLRNPKTSEARHLVTVYLPIQADGSVTKVFTGTKDYFLLSGLNEKLLSLIHI